MKVQSIFLVIIIFSTACTTAPRTVSVTPVSHPTSSNTPTVMPASSAMVTPIRTATVNLQPFDTVNIERSEIEFEVNGDGSNVDSISFWEAPDPADSLMFVTSKGNESLEVYQYPFLEQVQTISCGEESNGVWVDQERDVLYTTQRDSSHVCAYDLPSLDANDALSFTTAATGNNSEPNLTILTLPDGQTRIYVSYDDTVYYYDAVTGGSLGEFTTQEGLETMYGDDYYQVLYIPDEGGGSGVFLYDPDGEPAGSPFGGDGVFDSDAEGIWVYKCLVDGTEDNGEGLIVVSDQKDDLTDFEVFNRKTREHLGKINISGVNNTDGISITQQSSEEYPMGLLAVIDDDASAVGVGWDMIFSKTGLFCGN